MRSINNPSFQSEARRHSNYAEAHKLFPGDPERAESYGYLRALSSPASFNYQSPDGSDRSSMNLRDQQNAVTALTTRYPLQAWVTLAHHSHPVHLQQMRVHLIRTYRLHHSAIKGLNHLLLQFTVQL